MLVELIQEIAYIVKGLTKWEEILTRLTTIEAIVRQIAANTSPPIAARVVFAVTIDGVTREDVSAMQFKVTQQFPITLTFQDAAGNPAQIQGVPEWTNNNTNVLSMEVAADGMSAVVSAVGPAGSGQISVKADSNLGEGITEITGVLDVEALPGDATVITLNTGSVTDRT